MDPLSLTIFILAFAFMVLIHEFGHYIVARWCGIEVEEFGLGLPTPGALTLWTNKGYLLLRDGRRIEIPKNFNFPVDWNELVDRDVKLTVDLVDDSLVLRSIEYVRFTEVKRSTAAPQASGHVYVDPQTGSVVQPKETEDRKVSREVVKFGKTSGTQELTQVVAEAHPGTRFTLNWLPLGGFVRPKGENDPNIKGGLAAASPMKRLAVLFAGPLMNLLTALLIYSFIVSRIGAYEIDRVLITSTMPDSPAAQAGLQAGDIFVSGNGETIDSFNKLSEIVGANTDKPINFVIDRNGQPVETTVTPRLNAEEGRPMIGVGLAVPHRAITSPVEVVQWGARYTYTNIRLLISLPAQLIRGSLAPEQSRLVGLKGIYDIMQYSVERGIEASETASASQPFDWYIPTLEIIAALSISLGIFNLFPFPALDGGRIIFVLPELILRRRVPHQFENLVHGLGMAFLLLVMLYVNIMDFVKPLQLP